MSAEIHMGVSRANDVATTIAQDALRMGLSLSETSASKLDQYLSLLAKWNKVYNLTAVRDPIQMRVQHLNDSLAVIPALVREVHQSPARILDVGSGAGLPGVVICIVNSDLRVTCVDTVGKKVSFIQQVAAELQLSNLTAQHARVESLRDEPYDVITSRAFSSLADFVALTRHLLADHGVWMALKGKVPSDEITELPDDVEVFHVEQIAVERLEAQRCIVWMRSKPTPLSQAAPERQS